MFQEILDISPKKGDGIATWALLPRKVWVSHKFSVCLVFNRRFWRLFLPGRHSSHLRLQMFRFDNDTRTACLFDIASKDVIVVSPYSITRINKEGRESLVVGCAADNYWNDVDSLKIHASRDGDLGFLRGGKLFIPKTRKEYKQFHAYNDDDIAAMWVDKPPSTANLPVVPITVLPDDIEFPFLGDPDQFRFLDAPLMSDDDKPLNDEKDPPSEPLFSDDDKPLNDEKDPPSEPLFSDDDKPLDEEEDPPAPKRNYPNFGKRGLDVFNALLANQDELDAYLEDTRKRVKASLVKEKGESVLDFESLDYNILFD